MQSTTSPIFDPHGTRNLEVLADADNFNRWTYQSIAPYLKGDVLEIGSGIANISAFAVDAGHSITLSDINPEYRHALDMRFGNTPNVKGILAIDLQHPDFIKEYQSLGACFDSIFMLNVIEHLKDDAEAIRNCRFLLKPAGQLIVLAPSYQSLFCRLDKQLGHYRRYTTRSLSEVLAPHGFVLITRFYFNFAGISGWFVFGKLLNRSTLGKEMMIFNKLVPLFRVLDKITFRRAGLSSIVIAKLPA